MQSSNKQFSGALVIWAGMTARGYDVSQPRSLPKQITQSLFHNIASDLCNGSGKRNILGAHFNTILGITALVDTAVTH